MRQLVEKKESRAHFHDSSSKEGPDNENIQNVFLGRQPIYDADRKIHAYELLFRGSDAESADVTDGNRATAQVLRNTFIDIGVEKLSSNELLFINCTRDVLMSNAIIPPLRCVLEVLEDIQIDEELLERMRELRKAGYQLALDDFVYEERLAPMVELANYVKLDVLALPPDRLQEHVHQLRRYPVRLIAEKIDSEQQLDSCRKLGFDFFQGHYLRRPDVLSGKRIGTSKLAQLRLITECRKPDITLNEIAAAITADVSITYSLLRLANSAMFGRRNRVESVPQTVSLLGTDCVMRWATILALASDPDCPSGYIECALQRGHMCELLAIDKSSGGPETFFLIGLLSVLDSIIGTPMADIVQQLPLTAVIKAALLKREGEPGQVLESVLAYEAGDWTSLQDCGADTDSLHRAYWRSIEFASDTMRSLTSLRI